MMIEERECATRWRSNDLETRVFPTSEFAPAAGGGGTGRTANSVGARARGTGIRRSVFLKNLLTYTMNTNRPNHCIPTPFQSGQIG